MASPKHPDAADRVASPNKAGSIADIDVERARKGHKHDGFPELPHPNGLVNDAGDEVDPGPSRAAPSVWHLAAGEFVTTARWGGRHVETRP